MRRRLLAATAALALGVAVPAATSTAQIPTVSTTTTTSAPPSTPPPSRTPPSQPPPPQPPPPAPSHPAVPADSGTGRRIVYSVSQQRVWLVEGDERVSASWLVSGRRGIPRPGTYRVYSRSRWSSANRGRVRMEFMVRFAKTPGEAIGFHSIPVDRRGRAIQSESELGRPRSRGCVRQRRGDAERLWHWAPDGTVVRVAR